MINIGDIVIFTIREVTRFEYVVSLDEYNDMLAYINLIDVRNKLKVGSKNFGEVLYIYGSVVYLSLFNITIYDRRLFRLCRKLSYLDGPKDGWYSVCHNAIAENGVHPIRTISDRSFIEDRPEIFFKEYNECIIRNHAKLFGIKPYVMREKIKLISLADNKIVVDELTRIINEYYSRKYTDNELFKDWNKFNICITPIALPIFEIKVSAYLKSKCATIISDVIGRFRESTIFSGTVSGW